MRITKVTTFIPMVSFRAQCLVKVDTDAGISGWGESGLSSHDEAVSATIGEFEEFLIGADPMARNAIWQRLYRSQYVEGGSVLAAAVSAVDIALYDIAGKALRVPVYELLGGRQREYVPLFATIGPLDGAFSPEQERTWLEVARQLVVEGWPAIRIFPVEIHGEDPSVFEPRDSLAVTADWLVKLRREVGSGTVLGIDWHHRLTAAETASFVARMPPGTIDFIEEPIRAESPDAYEQLRRTVTVPLAIGEEFASKWAFAPFIERGLTDMVRLDICCVGGFTEAMKVAGMAEAHYLDVMPHNPLGPICTAASAHFCLAVPNLSWLEIRRSPGEDLGFYDAELFPQQAEQDGPRLTVSDAPGLGVDVDEAKVIAAATKPWKQPTRRRRDGSIQNW